MKRAKPGTVGIEKYKGHYRLRLPRTIADGSGRYISTGLAVDDPNNLKQVQRLAWDIEDDIANGRFSLSKYKVTKVKKPWLTLKEIWQLFTECKKSDLAISTLNKSYNTWARLIESLPYQYPEDAKNIKIWLLNNKSSNGTKQFIIHVSAALDWAVDRGLIDTNSFKGLATGIKSKKSYQIDPFTTFEMLAILQSFQDNHYESFVWFLFLTGCRTGEAIALQWKQVALDYSYVVINTTYYLELRLRKPTKNKQARQIPCNPQLSQLLQGLTRGSPTDQVFPSLQGCVINNHNFLLYHWRPKITQLIEQGLVERYRPVCNTRHTAITRMLEAGLTAAEVARIVGNSPRVINEHYAGVSRFTVLPEI
ncbi:tyrosine-type recombinase/integrase [Nostoc sp.]|uniref:tyrosine-type recombinase/integrase n=1 Tax=Nostoc sp. TaxID=1180 RepID=UPI002FF7933A